MEPPLESPQIYQLRIVLRAVSPLVWRRILVRDDLRFAQLHGLIQILFDWDNERLHHSHIFGNDYGTLTEAADSPWAVLKQFHFCQGERFLYIYDYFPFMEVLELRLGSQSTKHLFYGLMT